MREGISTTRRYGDLVGERFERLVVLAYSGSKSGQRQWLCVCDCGKTVDVITSRLRSGMTKSCGCLRSDAVRDAQRTHGYSETPEWRAWKGMLDRCYNPNIDGYKNYGGRGIRVSEEWHAFPQFIADMGDRPSAAHSLDRIDNDGDYEPSNCRWATKDQQSSNRRNNRHVTVNGETRIVAEWATLYGIPRGRLYRLTNDQVAAKLEALSRELECV